LIRWAKPDEQAQVAERPDEFDFLLARYLKPDLLIVDDMGMKQLPKHPVRLLIH